jgi:hypothetical protein
MVRRRRRITERRLVDVLANFAGAEHEYAREVKHYEKRIDLVLLNDSTDEVWAVEAKTKDWLRAMSQAYVNLSTAHRSFIALHVDAIPRVDRRLLSDYGLGLIAVGTKWGDVEVLESGKLSPYLNKLAVERIRKQIKRRWNHDKA